MGAARLQTQTEAFWRNEYEVTEGDLDLITGLILDEGKPQPLSALVSTVIQRRCHREKEAASIHAKSGQIYQPKGQFPVGQRLVFTALDYAVGRVTTVRPGNNPKFGPFAVAGVAFDGDTAEREFAVELDIAHPLNRPVEELLGTDDETISEGEIATLYAPLVTPKLEAALQSRDEFLTFDNHWFVRDLLPDRSGARCAAGT